MTLKHRTTNTRLPIRRALMVAQLTALACVATAEETPAANWRFEDVTAQVVDTNPPGVGPMFDYAFLDINDDNCLDIVVNNHHRTKPSPVWLGTPDHKFEFWQNMPQAHVAGSGFYLAEVDINGDGKTDLVYTGNEGGVIVNVNTAPPGARQPTYAILHDKGSSPIVAFADFAGDGVVRMLSRPGRVHGPTLANPVKAGTHYGSWVVADFDNDGWPDLFATGDESGRFATFYGPRKLLRNNRGTLEETGADSSLIVEAIGGVVRAGDFNNDGNLDILVFSSHAPAAKEAKKSHYSMKLYLGDGAFGFADVTESAGLAASTLKGSYSHAYLADLDNDTFTDIVIEGNYGTRVWRNNGDGTFALVDKMPWAVAAHMRFDDYDMDGRLDVVTTAPGPGWQDRATTVRVFRNMTDSGNNWLKLQLRQPGGNNMALGASVTVYASGTRTVVGRQMVAADSMGSHPRLHFGLGQHAEVDVDVVFPAGDNRRATSFRAVRANSYLILRPDGSLADVKPGG